MVGTYGEITRAITRDYATITPLGGREITRFSFLCPTPLGHTGENIREFLPRRTGTEKKRRAMVMSIFTRAKSSCLVTIQFFFFCFVPYIVHVAHTNGKNCILWRSPLHFLDDSESFRNRGVGELLFVCSSPQWKYTYFTTIQM